MWELFTHIRILFNFLVELFESIVELLGGVFFVLLNLVNLHILSADFIFELWFEEGVRLWGWNHLGHVLLKLLSFVLLHNQFLPELRQIELHLFNKCLVWRFGVSLRCVFLIQLALEITNLLVQSLHRILQLVVFGLDRLNSRFGTVGYGLFNFQVLEMLSHLRL